MAVDAGAAAAADRAADFSMSAAKKAKVIFQPSGKSGNFALGTNVLAAARQLGVQIESVCGGRGICGKCQISVAEGEFAKFAITSKADHLSERGPLEKRYDSKRGLAPDRRLSCSTTIKGDLVIDVPAASIIAGQTIRKDANTIGLTRNPALKLCYVELSPPDLHTPVGDVDRLIAALKETFALNGVQIPFAMLAKVQSALAASAWKITACVDVSGPLPELIAVFGGYSEQLSGLAVDIGSTTIAAHLVDLMSGQILASSGRANPQIRFGEDLMSRVSYVMMNEGGREKLTKVIRDCLNEMIEELLEKTARNRAHLLDAVLVSNPVMHHLFLGFDPTPLGQAPFNPAVSRAVRADAGELDLKMGAGAKIYYLPIVAGHVGADAAAVILAEQPESEQNPVLIVDVGTNAEIVLWDGATLYAASSPTGPALEGAEISSGQRAAPGAIERIRINRQTLEARYKVIGATSWSDDINFLDEIKKTGISGICGSAIIEVIGEMALAGIVSSDGIIRAPQNDAEQTFLVKNERTWSYVVREKNPTLLITQNDVRAIQLAKSALYAGVKLLLDKTELSQINDIRLAGAFGSYIDPQYALLLGLVPDTEPENVKAVGNAAGQGALAALLDVTARRKIEKLVLKITKVETALEPEFQRHFVAAIGLPNSSDPFEKTRAHFKMQPMAANSGSQKPKRRGGRRKR
ncbi:Iron-sulfur cluster-binding protein [hydrothermal vent metagenome]|uniref:Iron-sulfur cluster-binding protein n=1 Tax=hydrothermal vent metagenome TaxID=652676 RepID=A0A3B0U1V9_9ZZZZ